MTRIEAATKGVRIYDAANPCKRDGTRERYTTNGGCVACEKRRSAGNYERFKTLLNAAKQV